MIGVARSGNQERPVFFIYDHSTGLFQYNELVGVHYQDAVIKNIVANDFNEDENIDLLITFSYNKQNNTNITNTHLLLYDPTTSIYKTAYQFNDLASGIFIADFGESRGLDFLYYDSEANTRKVIYFDKDSRPVIKDFKNFISKDITICDRSLVHLDYPISNPHSSAFVDIDGDCINDLIIMSKFTIENKTENYLEIWRGVIEDDTLVYCLSQSSIYKLDNNLGLFSLADINRDALIDIVFPVLNSSPPQILIGYNKVQLSYDWTQDYCATHESITNPSNKKIPLIFDELRTESTRSHYVELLTLTNSDKHTFYNNLNFPTLIRFGDINQDSYPDLTVVLYDKSDYSQNTYVFLNTPFKEYRNFNTSNYYFVPYVSNAIYSSFFDMDEDGKLDLIIVKQENNSTFYTEGYYNTYSYDSFYLKSLVLNEENSFFSNEIGTSFRFITTNIDGSRRMDLSFQAIQVSSPMALNLPYAFMGIGRSNNYIENFHVISGNFLNLVDRYKVFTPIIPNSQILVRHYKTIETNQTIVGNSTDFNSTTYEVVIWKLDLLVKPTTKLSILITMIILILSGLFFGIAYLHVKETNEDTIENQKDFQFW
jgi:integrin alpha FG-GAP repeat containing protein 1